MVVNMNEHRTEYDILRILAIVLVIYHHTVTNGFFYFSEFFNPDTRSLSPWYSSLFMVPSIICIIDVPLFFMISGALLLGKEESILTVWKKRIVRYFLVLLVISAYYYYPSFLFESSEAGIGDFLVKFFSQGLSAHLWFLYSYISYLIILPFLRYIAKSMTRNSLYYLFGLSVVFNGIIPIVRSYVFEDRIVTNPSFLVGSILSIVVFYPLLGYGFTKYKVSKRAGQGILLVGLFSLIPVVLMTIHNVRNTGVCDFAHEDAVKVFWSCFNELRAVGVFVCICAWASNHKFSEVGKRILAELGSCVFGIYLFEDIVRDLITEDYYEICPWPDNYFVVWVLVLFVFVFTAVLVYILRRIPIVKRFI